MKKTVYFAGIPHQNNQLEKAIQMVVQKRDAFLEQNKNNIVKIDVEDIIITVVSNQLVLPTIKLTYYPK